MLIKNGTVVTLDEKNTFIENGAVYIKDNIIKEIGKSKDLEKKYLNEEIVDANGNYIMPGLICSHYHVYSAFARGMSLDGEPASNFIEVLRKVWWRMDKKLTLDDIYYSALVSAIEAIKCGTTCVIDHHASPYACTGSLKTISGGFLKAGLRGNYCYEVSERDGMKIAEEGLYENYNFIKKCNENKNDMCTGSFGLHASFTLSDETLKKAVDMKNELGCGFHVHAAEGAADQELCIYNHNKRVIERFYDLGVLGNKTLAIHGVYANDNEIDLLKQTDTMIVHNPESNMNNAVGVPPILKMIDKGMTVGLGTDGFTSNMFREIQHAYVVHKLVNHDPRVMGVPDLKKIAVDNNGKIVQRLFGRPSGQIKEGYFGDIIIVDYNSPTPIDGSNAYGHLIFGLNSNNIKTTIINGKVVMQDGNIINIDENKVMEKSREYAKKLWERI